MLAVGAVKLIGQIAVNVGVGTVTKLLVKSITPSNATKAVKVAVGIGSFVISSVITAQASKKWNDDVDNVVKIVKKIKKFKDEESTEESKPETEAE